MSLTSLTTEDVLFTTQGPLARIVLNRPRAINALTLPMVRDLHALLDRFAADAAIGAVVVQGAGERGLCSGGDVRAVRQHVADTGDAGPFFATEYAMNAAVADFPKPYVALMDGIVMGGGVGVSAHGSVRLATTRTRLAMPETTIGFTADVGAQWWLSRTPGRIGAWMALTSDALDGAGAVAAGFADVLVAPDVMTRLTDLDAGPDPWLLAVAESGTADLDVLGETVPDSPLAAGGAARAWIDECFGGWDVATILDRLAAHPEPAARECLETLRQRCPFSLVVTLEAMRRASTMGTVHEVLAQDTQVCPRVAELPDFAEGVRAQLVDKDRRPTWRDSSIQAVDPAVVERVFAA